MKRIKMHIGTGYAGADHVDFIHVPDEWDEMTEKERQSYLDEVAKDFLGNNIEYSAWVVDDAAEDEDYIPNHFSDANN